MGGVCRSSDSVLSGAWSGPNFRISLCHTWFSRGDFSLPRHPSRRVCMLPSFIAGRKGKYAVLPPYYRDRRFWDEIVLSPLWRCFGDVFFGGASRLVDDGLLCGASF